MLSTEPFLRQKAETPPPPHHGGCHFGEFQTSEMSPSKWMWKWHYKNGHTLIFLFLFFFGVGGGKGKGLMVGPVFLLILFVPLRQVLFQKFWEKKKFPYELLILFNRKLYKNKKKPALCNFILDMIPYITCTVSMQRERRGGNFLLCIGCKKFVFIMYKIVG